MTRSLRAVFVDANPTLGKGFEQTAVPSGVALHIHRQPDITPDQLPAVLEGADIAIVDHTALPTEIAKQCPSLKDVVFLGTGARSYMDPEALAELGITVHTIKGYGDTAVAECAFALMWAASKGLAGMDRAMRDNQWVRTDGIQLTGKTLGLVGYGGIAAELARLANGIGMRVVAWNRTPRTADNVEFLPLEEVLAQSHVVSLHLLLTDETRGMIDSARLAQMREGAILINTARGALVDEDAMVAALSTGRLAHAGLDVYTVEPLPADHPLTRVPNVTLSAHSAFRTPEATQNLIDAALAHCAAIVAKR